MTALLLTVITASLVGSLHCVGMCGGFVAFYSGSDSSQGWRRLISHTVYSLGRLVSYVVLGALAGGFGRALDLAGSLNGFQRSAALIAGIAMVIWGVFALLRAHGLLRWPLTSNRPGIFARIVKSSFKLAGGKPPIVRATLVGLLSGLLPCGWLWAFIVAAAGTGSALKGGLVMMAFWAGTVPALFGLGLGAQYLGGPLRKHLPSITAVLVVALGIVAIVGRPSSSTAMVKHQHPLTTEEAADHVKQINDEKPPCCAGE